MAIVKNLLAAANKYQIELLRFTCEQDLAGCFTVDNCVELLVLADLHSAGNLKEAALKFICANWTEVGKTEGWGKFKQNDEGSNNANKLICEVLTACMDYYGVSKTCLSSCTRYQPLGI